MSVVTAGSVPLSDDELEIARLTRKIEIERAVNERLKRLLANESREKLRLQEEVARLIAEGE